MEVSTVINEKGKKLLIVNRFIYSRPQVYSEGILCWRCIDVKCPSRVTTCLFEDTNVQDFLQPHNHNEHAANHRDLVARYTPMYEFAVEMVPQDFEVIFS